MKICGTWPENSGTNVEKSCYLFKIAPFGKTTSGQTRASLILFTECEQKKFSRAVKLPSSYPEEFLEEKSWNYKINIFDFEW